MKLLSIILIMYLITPITSNNTFVNNYESNITITSDKLVIESQFETWKVKHHIILKPGKNSGYYVLKEGQSFEYKIVNY